MNTVYRLTPVSQYDMSGLESWLEDMARGGLYLKRFRPLFCSFTRGEPSRTRYRLEPSARTDGNSPPQSMLELYGAFGWECVMELTNSLLLFSTRDPDARELHTDPALQGELWNKLRRSTRLLFWISAIADPLLVLLYLGLLFHNRTPVLLLSTTSMPFVLLFLLYQLALLPTAFVDWRRMERLTRRLGDGLPMDHRTAYPRRRPLSLLSFCVSITLALLLLADPLVSLTGDGPMSISQLHGFVPLSLSSLEGPQYQPAHFMLDGVDYASFCDLDRALLCPTQWDVVQHGDRGSDGVQPRLELEWYGLLLSPLAVPLAREQLANAVQTDPSGPVQPPYLCREYRRADTDYLAVAERRDGSLQAAAAARGGRVVVVRYTGHGTLSQFVQDIAAMVQE